jgi:hypothetical protein
MSLLFRGGAGWAGFIVLSGRVENVQIYQIQLLMTVESTLYIS